MPERNNNEAASKLRLEFICKFFTLPKSGEEKMDFELFGAPVGVIWEDDLFSARLFFRLNEKGFFFM